PAAEPHAVSPPPSLQGLTDRILVRPIVPGRLLADQQHRLRTGAVLRGEAASAQKRNAHRAEIIRRRDANLCAWLVRSARRRPTANGEGETEARRGERKRKRDACRAHTR